MVTLTPDDERLLAAALVLLAYLLFCGLVALRERRRRAAHASTVSGGTAGAIPTLIAYASQTGLAEQIAWRTPHSLQAAGTPTRVMALEAVDADRLAAAGRALFVVSTTGEGDAPDGALAFVRKVMARPAALDHLRYGLLALGDRSYVQFCGFGRTRDGWLGRQDAVPLFERIEVDNADDAALDRWGARLSDIAGADTAFDASAKPYESWTLAARRHLNPGSPGDPAFHVALVSAAGAARWTPGDIVEIEPQNDPADVQALLLALGLDGATPVARSGAATTLADALARSQLPRDPAAVRALLGRSGQTVTDDLRALAARDYSIASIAESGRIELLVRRTIHPDGGLGLGRAG